MKTGKQYFSFTFIRACLFSIVSCLAFGAHADSWKLDKDASSINFFSIKKGSVGETHRFTDFSGSIDGEAANIIIKADSIDSRIPIRNERMREFLFETKTFPTIEINANLNEKILNAPEGVSQHELAATLDLHGTKKEITIHTLVSRTKGSVNVSSYQPVIIKSSDYNLLNGVKKLSELVGGIDIGSAVPVNFNLVFTSK